MNKWALRCVGVIVSYVLSFGPVIFVAVLLKIDRGDSVGIMISFIYYPHFVAAEKVSIYEKYLGWLEISAIHLRK